MTLLLRGFILLMTALVLRGLDGSSESTKIPDNTTGSLFTEMPEYKTESLFTEMSENTTGSLFAETPENTTGSLFTELPKSTVGSLFTELSENTTGSLFHENSTFDGNTSLYNSTADLFDEYAYYNYDDDQYYDDESDIELWFIDNSKWYISGPGVIFNTITITVVVSRMKPFNSNSLFMMILAIIDLTNVTVRIVDFITFTFLTITDISCKIIDYLYFFSITYSNIIVVCWSLERLIAVWFPLKYRQHNSLKKTAVVLGIAGMVMALLSMPYTIYGYSADEICQYHDFLHTVWTSIETVYYIWIPGFVISLSNVLIVYKLVSNRKGTLSQAMSTERTEQRAREERQMTNVLMSVSLVFLILHLPQAVTSVYLSITEDEMPSPSLLWSYIVSEIQNCVNFFLYCLTGRDFRGYVLQMFCSCRKNV